MQEAIDRRTEHTYTAFELSRYTEQQRQEMSGHLQCKGCTSNAHYRRESEPPAGRKPTIPHFFCRPHAANCDIIKRNGDPWETDENDATVSKWEKRNQTLIVRIQLPMVEAGAPASEAKITPEDTRTGLSGTGGQTGRSGPLSRGPQRLLEQLLHWPSFKTSALPMRMPDLTTVPVHDGFVRFSDAHIDHHIGRWLGFWGVVQNLNYWAYGDSYYSNFGTDKTSFRISIHKPIAEAVVERYRLKSIHDLAGHHLLLFDLARESNSGRFTADIISVHHIGFLKGD